MTRILISEAINKVGDQVVLKGWVHARRNLGKMVFFDLRDMSGLMQVIVPPNAEEATIKAVKEIRPEFVVSASGVVQARKAGSENDKLASGKLELLCEKLEILNEAKTPPFEIDNEDRQASEELRLKYRYLDLRHERLQKNLSLRHEVILFIRQFLSERGFREVETPILSKSTPEGARDYLVPSRLYKGKFYALPQSPQQYKQLLMCAGVERYFQIARCFRDEDTRGDRQPEFTQLDLEMSFVEREDVMRLNEELLIEIIKNICPEKKIQEVPFPRLTYNEVMNNYRTDRPDLRKDKNDPNLLAFCWVVDFPFFEKDDDSPTGWTFTHNPFSKPKDEYIEAMKSFGVSLSQAHILKNDKVIPTILTTQYDIVLNGWEIGGGSIRNHKLEDLLAVFKILGYSGKEVTDNFSAICHALQLGAPPHGGIAWGLDRLIMVLANEPNIREVIAFPKTADAKDLLMGSPDEVTPEQLNELGIEVK